MLTNASRGWNTLRINGERFRANFEALSRIGATPAGGVHRPAFNAAHQTARQWFLRQIADSGLEASVDEAGNHSAILRCGQSDAPTLLLGSHLDSVPQGGRFDGALGVLAAFEVLQTIKDAGLALRIDLEAIDFSDEEGSYVTLLGSRALTGKLCPDHLETPRAGRTQFEMALKQAALQEQNIFAAQRDFAHIAAYLELHIEQGARLSEAQQPIGIVTAIVGICSYRLNFIGKANHAGTTPMLRRQDAALGASAFTLAARELVINDFPDCVMNVGQMEFAPGAFNVVPEKVSLALEFRAPDVETLDCLEAALLDKAVCEAQRFDLSVEHEFVGKVPPAPMSQDIQTAFIEACTQMQLSSMSLPSGAWHDAQSFADLCPTGMIFVPSVNGISHSAEEFSEWTDCVNGANVLLQAVLHLELATT